MWLNYLSVITSGLRKKSMGLGSERIMCGASLVSWSNLVVDMDEVRLIGLVKMDLHALMKLYFQTWMKITL